MQKQHAKDAAKRREREVRDRDMPLVVREAGKRLQGGKASRAALASLKHAAAQQQQEYKALQQEHEQLQETAAVCRAKLAAAEAVRAADALLLKHLIPSLVLECAAQLSIQQATGPTRNSPAASPTSTEARCLSAVMAQQQFVTRTPEHSHPGMRPAAGTPAQASQSHPAGADTDAGAVPQPGSPLEAGNASAQQAGAVHAGPTGHVVAPDGASSDSSNSGCSSNSSSSGTYTARRKLQWGQTRSPSSGAAPVRILQLCVGGTEQEAAERAAAISAPVRAQPSTLRSAATDAAAAAAAAAAPGSLLALDSTLRIAATDAAAAAAPGSLLALDTRHSICSGSSKSMCLMGSPVKGPARVGAVREWDASAADVVSPTAVHDAVADPGAPAAAEAAAAQQPTGAAAAAGHGVASPAAGGSGRNGSLCMENEADGPELDQPTETSVPVAPGKVEVLVWGFRWHKNLWDELFGPDSTGSSACSTPHSTCSSLHCSTPGFTPRALDAAAVRAAAGDPAAVGGVWDETGAGAATAASSAPGPFSAKLEAAAVLGTGTGAAAAAGADVGSGTAAMVGVASSANAWAGPVKASSTSGATSSDVQAAWDALQLVLSATPQGFVSFTNPLAEHEDGDPHSMDPDAAHSYLGSNFSSSRGGCSSCHGNSSSSTCAGLTSEGARRAYSMLTHALSFEDLDKDISTHVLDKQVRALASSIAQQLKLRTLGPAAGADSSSSSSDDSMCLLSQALPLLRGVSAALQDTRQHMQLQQALLAAVLPCADSPAGVC